MAETETNWEKHMGRAKIGDILVKTGSTKTGEQGGKDTRKIIGTLTDNGIENLDSLPTAEPGRPPVNAIEVKVEGGYKRIA